MLSRNKRMLVSDSDESVTGVDVLICSFLLVLALIAAYVSKKLHIVFLPESVSAMLLGMMFGGISKFFDMGIQFSFSPDLFFYGLLPIIIFNAGYALKKKDFFRNFATIILFAVVGTIISTLVYGLATYFLYTIGWVHDMTSESPLLECLMFGSLISAIDPVATLSVFQDLKAPSLLYNLVFGESLVNDASSIVLFRTFESFTDKDFSMSTIGVAILCFCGVSVGSIALGFAISLLCSLILKKIDIKSEYSKFELAFVLLSAYISYSVAELLSLSGIMSLFFCGICNSHYSYYNTSHATKISSKYAFEALAFMSELFLFAYLGMQVMLLDLEYDYGLLLSAIPLCLISRALNIFPLSWLADLHRSKKIPTNMKVMMWISGLRGAIAYALAVNLPTANRAIETTTLFVVVVTTLLLGSTTGIMLDGLGLLGKNQEASEPRMQNDLDVHLIGSASMGDILGDAKESRDPPSGIHRVFKWFDQTYLKPIFGGHSGPRIENSILGENEALLESDNNYKKYFGNGFQLSIPSDWNEVMGAEENGLLVKFVSLKSSTDNTPVAEVCVTVIPSEKDDVEDFGNPMKFLVDKWEELQLGEISTIRSQNQQSILFKKPSLSERQPIALIRPRSIQSENDLDKIIEVEESPALFESDAPVQVTRQVSGQFKYSSDTVELISDDEASFRGHAKHENSRLFDAAGSALKNQVQSIPVNFAVPAFVMWTENMRDEGDRVYFRYEIVIHPEGMESDGGESTKHVLLSASGIIGSVFVCKVQAMESWFYEEGAQVCKMMLDSFRVLDGEFRSASNLI